MARGNITPLAIIGKLYYFYFHYNMKMKIKESNINE